MKSKIETAVLIIVTVLTLIFGVFVLIEHSRTADILIAVYAVQLILPIYYLVKSEHFIYQILLLYFIVLPIGQIFYSLHYPLGSFLVLFGIIGYVSAGIYLFAKTNFSALSIYPKIELIVIALASISITAYVFTLDFLRLTNNVVYLYLNLFLLISSIAFIASTNTNKELNNQYELIRIIGINAILPVCILLIYFIK